MHSEVPAFVGLAADLFSLPGPVYHLGAGLHEGLCVRDELRSSFAGRNFVACETSTGPGVDRVITLEPLSLDEKSAATLICLDRLQCTYDVPRLVSDMISSLAPGGVLLLSAAMRKPLAPLPDDYWRITPTCMSRLLEPLAGSIVGWQGPEQFPTQVFGIGFAHPVPQQYVHAAPRFIEAYRQWLRGQYEALPWSTRFLHSVGNWRRRRAPSSALPPAWEVSFSMNLPPVQFLAELGLTGPHFSKQAARFKML